ncbi:hypothetical protein Ssi03_31730 [Sphaerisporangium siamense]|uniref:Lipoprotein n=1 Tax=Sphaerisporangium siamense TaxID=795645 RepID=A0A7W7G996_9ACTN|nr:hypothetical protein [Sphaerisporangium siamense]MBB4698756.1 hypothetical protein [Sphaerisporangium siamense]GII85183.1 hypothetical protein Ssi03_31730 [Sphaerisporangium siamense]
MRTRHLRRAGAGLAVAVALLAAGACGSGNADMAATSDATKQAAMPLDLSPLRSHSYNFAPKRTPEELARQSYVKVTAVGTVEGWQEGPTFITEPSNTPYMRVYMVVRLDKTFKKLEADHALRGGRVYVDLDRGPINTLDGRTPLTSMADFERAVPKGTKVALFLTNTPKISDRVQDAQRTAPVRPLAPHPQGMIIEKPSGLSGAPLLGGLVDLGRYPQQWKDIRSFDELANRMAAITQ